MPLNKSIDSVEQANEISKALKAIDEILERRTKAETFGLLSGLGGSVFYFANRFLQTRDERFLDKSLSLLEIIVESANLNSVHGQFNLANPICSPYWIIDQLIKQELLDSTEKPDSKTLGDLVINSVANGELESNRHDVFYGFIGNGLILLENDPDFHRPLILKMVEALNSNVTRDGSGIYWETPSPFYPSDNYVKTLNFGIPHGSLGIILFLLKCADTYKLHDQLRPLLTSSTNWIIDRLNNENNKLLYQYSSDPSGSGRLGWCYGDQSIAFTLLRFYETYGEQKAKVKAYELIEGMVDKPLSQTGISFFPEYKYLDVRLCHGTVSVAHMFRKMYQITNDNNILDLANKWIQITLENLRIYLPQIDRIAAHEKGNNEIDTSMGLLNGLSGVGLALMSFLNPELSDWDKILMLDRPKGK